MPLSFGQASNDDIYDEVTEQDYRQIVGNRLARDDFIEDDDGTGMYVDNGVDDDIGRRKGRNSEDESEEEEEYEARGEQNGSAPNLLATKLTASPQMRFRQAQKSQTPAVPKPNLDRRKLPHKPLQLIVRKSQPPRKPIS